MMNLKTNEKRLYFKILFHALIITTIVLLFTWFIRSNSDYIDLEKDKFEKYKIEQDSLVSNYRGMVDSINQENWLLEKEYSKINHKLDSVTKKQNQLNHNYEEEINNIRNATLADHSKWFYAKLDSLRQHYQPDSK